MQEMYNRREASNSKENHAKQIKNETNYRKNKEQVRNCRQSQKFRRRLSILFSYLKNS
jgi:hypothetical protein